MSLWRLSAPPSGRSFWPILLADPSGRSFWPILLRVSMRIFVHVEGSLTRIHQDPGKNPDKLQRLFKSDTKDPEKSRKSCVFENLKDPFQKSTKNPQRIPRDPDRPTRILQESRKIPIDQQESFKNPSRIPQNPIESSIISKILPKIHKKS